MRLHYFIFLCIISIACVSSLPLKKNEKESKQVSNAPAVVENEVVSNQADGDDEDDDEDIEDILDDDDDDDDDSDDADDADDDADGDEDDEDYLERVFDDLIGEEDDDDDDEADISPSAVQQPAVQTPEPVQTPAQPAVQAVAEEAAASPDYQEADTQYDESLTDNDAVQSLEGNTIDAGKEPEVSAQDNAQQNIEEDDDDDDDEEDDLEDAIDEYEEDDDDDDDELIGIEAKSARSLKKSHKHKKSSKPKKSKIN